METIENNQYFSSEPIAISIPEAARRCGISRAFMWKIIRHGSGPELLKIGRRTLVLVKDLNQWLQGQKFGGGHVR